MLTDISSLECIEAYMLISAVTVIKANGHCFDWTTPKSCVNSLSS